MLGVALHEEFVGFANYEASLADETFWKVIWMTFGYVGASLVLVNLVGFGLALLVTIPMRGANILRTAFFVPNLIGGVILGLIWQFLFDQALPTIRLKIANSSYYLNSTSGDDYYRYISIKLD